MMKLSLTSAVSIVGVVTGLIASTTAADASVTFTTFVPINGTFANLAFNYTGAGFVGESKLMEPPSTDSIPQT